MSRWWTWSPPKNDRSSQTELAKVIARVDEPSATKAVLTGISARRADGQATAVAAADTALAPVAPEILRSLFAFCRRRRACPRDLRERVEIRLPPKAADQFADAVASVRPAPIRDASLVRPIIAQALAVSTGDGDAVGDQRATAPGDRRVRLVLDNLEQVLGEVPRLAELLLDWPSLRQSRGGAVATEGGFGAIDGAPPPPVLPGDGHANGRGHPRDEVRCPARQSSPPRRLAPPVSLTVRYHSVTLGSTAFARP